MHVFDTCRNGFIYFVKDFIFLQKLLKLSINRLTAHRNRNVIEPVKRLTNPTPGMIFMLSLLGRRKYRLKPLKSITKLQRKMSDLGEKYDLGMAEIVELKREREEAALERQQMKEEIAALRERLAIFEDRLHQINDISHI